MAQETFKIRTHQQCVKDTKFYLKCKGLKLDIIEREAIVEFFLIEDLYAFVKFKMEKFSHIIESGLSDSFEMLHLSHLLNGYTYLSPLLSILIDFLGLFIEVAKYDIVRKSINESMIRRTISKMKSSKQMIKLNIIVLDTLYAAINFSFNDNIFNNASLESEKEIKEALENEKLKFSSGSKRKPAYEAINHSDINNLEDIMEKLWKLFQN